MVKITCFHRFFRTIDGVLARDLNFDISMCDHWSGILSSDQDGQDTSRPPPTPLASISSSVRGTNCAKSSPGPKAPLSKPVKSETDLLSICKSRLLFFHRSILKFSLHLACPRLPKNLTQEKELIRRRPAKSFPTTNEMLNKILKSESVGIWEFRSESKVIVTNSFLS